jgi:hypothetical protein
MTVKRSAVLLVAIVAWSAACARDPGGGGGSHPSPGGTGGEPDPTGGQGGGSVHDGGGGWGGSGLDASQPGDSGAGDSAPAPACAAGQKLLVCDPTMRMPKSIKDTGVYPAIPDLSRHSDRLLAYSPEPALWSDGLSKERFLLLPAGAKIDNTDPHRWVFPPGAVFVKSFFADDHKIIETRFVRRNEDQDFPFEYYTYRWNAAGTDAVMEGWMDAASFDPKYALWEPDPVAVTLQGKPHMHPIPGHSDCAACHDENRGKEGTGMAFIGFDEIRLNNTLPGAKETQLQGLAARGLFLKPPGASTITGTTDLERRVKRFIFGNCLHCHNDPNGNDGPMDLQPDVLLAQLRNVAIMGHIEAPPGFKRVVPGKPLLSVVYVQAARIADTVNKQYSKPPLEYHLRDMPPVGVTLTPSGANLPPDYPDGDPVKDLFDWITTLK